MKVAFYENDLLLCAFMSIGSGDGLSREARHAAIT